ncbi:MAG: FAD-dependent oxidoreductase [Acidimicrobiales bacterium]
MKAAVVGAGLTGALLAARLGDAGHRVDLYDRRPDLRRHDVDAGRSINLAISHRGLDALSRVDLDGTSLDGVVRDLAITMPGRMLHRLDGELVFQPYGTDPDHVLHSVNRDLLNATLLDTVERRTEVTTHFSARVRDVDVRTGALTVDTRSGDTAAPDPQREQYDVVFGADGAYSAMRGRLQRIGRVDYSQTFLAHGYKELTIPARADGTHALDPHALHIWPRSSQMMIALPNTDGSFTATLFWPFAAPGEPEAVSFDRVVTADDVAAAFARHYPDALELMPDLAAEYQANPASSLVTIRTGPWYHDDRLLIIGDAAHAVVPFYGQGANAALEDVTILFEHYARDAATPGVFARFYAERKDDADALADLAIEHYDEMRDSVRSRWFLATAALERALHRLAPDRFVPLYTMVSFTRIPYAQAVERSRRQHRVLGVTVAVALAAVALVVALVVWLMT